MPSFKSIGSHVEVLQRFAQVQVGKPCHKTKMEENLEQRVAIKILGTENSPGDLNQGNTLGG